MGTEHFIILLVGKRKRNLLESLNEQMQWKPNNSFWEGSARKKDSGIVSGISSTLN